MKDKIVIIEDEEAIRGLLTLFLENRSFEVYQAESGEAGLAIIQKVKPDLILLDIEMPTMDGFEVCEKIRAMLNVPIIFISSRRDLKDKVKSFELGGDDYLTKPFDFAELEARIIANIRRYTEMRGEKQRNIIRFHDVMIDVDQYECYIKGEKVPLSARELKILIVLAERPNHVWSAEKIYDHIWGYDSVGDVQTIKVHISNLRKKLQQYTDDVDFIETVRGFGYKVSS